MKITGFRFSVARYWLLVTCLTAVLLGHAFANNFYYSLRLFVIFGTAGILAEVLISMWWHYFFSQRFWVYTEEAIDHKYTSPLNFIPWAIGGFLFLYVAESILGDINAGLPEIEKISTIIFAAGILGQMLVFRLGYKNRKFHTLNFGNLALFYFPIFLTLLILLIIFGNVIWQLALAFGIVAAAAEYLFGKFMQMMLTKKLWVYNYLTMDKGHFTILSIPLFTLAGFCILILMRTVG